MGTLLIIRHGQASFMADNYDQLSALGQTQGRLLGQAWAAAGLYFDRACSGPRERQKGTAEIVAAAYAAVGVDFPEIESYPEFDEYHADAVLSGGLASLSAHDANARELQRAFTHADDSNTRHAAFQRMFEYVIVRWVRGELVLSDVESWGEFRTRVNAGFDRLLAAQRQSERVAVFTSAGPMAIAVQRALGISDEKTIALSWMPRNASWSEFFHAPEKLTLSTFNAHGHLVDPAQLTYR
jgi:broad specificity phosphatase PhoE